MVRDLVVTETSKKCKDCQETKSVDNFFINKRNDRKRGYQIEARCKDCRKIIQAEYRARTKERNQKEKCSRPNCDARRTVLGPYCGAHRRRHYAGEDMDAPVSRRDNPGEWGAPTLNSSGYLVLHRRVNGRKESKLHHRYVMEEKLGRELTSDENVHHIDHDKTNNDPENLELWTVGQPPGIRMEDKEDWAEKLLLRVRPESLAHHVKDKWKGEV